MKLYKNQIINAYVPADIQETKSQQAIAFSLSDKQYTSWNAPENY
jgi:hypothetical protein